MSPMHVRSVFAEIDAKRRFRENQNNLYLHSQESSELSGTIVRMHILSTLYDNITRLAKESN